MQETLYNDSSIECVFYTVSGQRPLVTRDQAFTVPAGSGADLNNDLVAIQTQDDMQQDIPSATIALADKHNWSTLLSPNDYVEIHITYHSNIFSKETGQPQTFTLYCGLISDIRRVDDPASNSRTYVVATQGMAKVLQNINLGSFTELTSESVPMFPDEEGQGIRVSGRSSANIIVQILNRFVWKELINYNFGINGGQTNTLQDLLKITDANGQTTIIGNVEEAQSLPEGGISFLGNYNGTILQMIKDTASRPFNELFWTHEEGKATFHYRPTPFDQDIWKSLPYLVIEPNAIMNEEIDVSDSDQSSVFKVTPSEKTGQDTSNWIDGMAPITDAETSLISRYGYKIMNVSTDYFAGINNEDKDSDVATSIWETAPSQTVINNEQAKKHYPPYVSVADILGTQDTAGYTNTQLATHTLPDGLPGIDDYEGVKSAIKNSTKEDFKFQANSITNGKMSTEEAGKLWDRYNTNQDELGRVAYLQAIYPNYYIPTTPGTAKNQKLTHLYSVKAMKAHPKKAANQLIQGLNRTIGSKQAYEIIKKCIANGDVLSEDQYFDILNTYKYDEVEDGVSDTGRKGTANNVPAMIEKYTEKLFNWYADNSKFYSGTITITGTKGVELGKRLFIKDNDAYWEFYIESVGHSYDFQKGWTTSIGVTRGLPVEKINSDRRFQQPYSFYGNFARFNGGYFGEETLGTLQEKARTNAEDGGSNGSDSDDADTGTGKVTVSNKIDPQWGCYTYMRKIADDAIKYGKKISGADMYITSGYRTSDTYGHAHRQAVDVAFPPDMTGSPYYTKVANYIFKKYSKEIGYVLANGKAKDRSGLSGTGSSGTWVTFVGEPSDHMHLNGWYGTWGSKSKKIK